MTKPTSTYTRRLGELLLAVCLLAALLIPSAQATPGQLDPSFGTGGTVTNAIGPGNDSAWSLALQPDGKLVAAGNSWNGASDFALARYNPDGSLDTSFHGTGKVTTAMVRATRPPSHSHCSRTASWSPLELAPTAPTTISRSLGTTSTGRSTRASTGPAR
jgi:uncharacterized delta-60 repeat protein